MIPLSAFKAAFADELRGLLLESFAEALKVGDHATNGQRIIQQMKRADNLLERCYYKLAGDPESNGKIEPPKSTAAKAK